MTPSSSVEARLAELDTVRGSARADASLVLLRRALASKTALVVARAAGLAGAESVTEVAPDLLKAFARLLEAPAKADPGCLAETAIGELFRACFED